jgi:hypothetical protein
MSFKQVVDFGEYEQVYFKREKKREGLGKKVQIK